MFSGLTLFTLVRERKKFKNEFVLPQCMRDSIRLSSTSTSTSTNNNSSTNENNHEFKRVSKRKLFSRRPRLNSHLSKLKLSLMLMTFPLSFLVTTFPVFVIITLRLLVSYSNVKFDTDFESEFAIAKTFMYANNSFNIFLYILLGKTLRRDMLNVFRCTTYRGDEV